MLQLDMAEAKTQLQELLEVALKGEEVVIVKGDRPIAKLVSVTEKPRRQFGSMKDIIWVADDFDEPLTEEFKEYIE